MTKISLLNNLGKGFAVLAVLCGLAYVAGLSGCTDSEQQAQIDRQKHNEEREAKDQADKEARIEAEAKAAMVAPADSPTPTAVQTPETPPEPEKVDNVVWKNIQCQCHSVAECGVTMWGCSDGKTHACMHDLEYAIISVDKTDSNDGQCGS